MARIDSEIFTNKKCKKLFKFSLSRMNGAKYFYCLSLLSQLIRRVNLVIQAYIILRELDWAHSVHYDYIMNTESINIEWTVCNFNKLKLFIVLILDSLKKKNTSILIAGLNDSLIFHLKWILLFGLVLHTYPPTPSGGGVGCSNKHHHWPDFYMFSLRTFSNSKNNHGC